MSKAFVTVDLSFGDCGKGTIVDALTRRHNSDLVVRYSGASQCAHNVETDEGIQHTFSQFGSGTFAGARTFLSRKVLINPLSMEDEEKYLRAVGVMDAFDRMYVDENCIIITPFHRAMNKLVELSRGDKAHGSCANGVWEAVRDSMKGEEFTLRVKDINSPKFMRKLVLIQAWKNYEFMDIREAILALGENKVAEKAFEILHSDDSVFEVFSRYQDWIKKVNIVTDYGKELINTANNPIFEANQGVLLDDQYGFHPYSTPTKTTTEHAISLLHDVGFKGEVETVGITRSYFTRHGAGPFPTEDKDSKLSHDDNNTKNRWQGEFRSGALDLMLIRHAIMLNGGIDSLAITHVDKLDGAEEWPICTGYKMRDCQVNMKMETKLLFSTPRMFQAIPIYTTVKPDDVLSFITNTLNIPLSIISKGKAFKDKIFLDK